MNMSPCVTDERREGIFVFHDNPFLASSSHTSGSQQTVGEVRHLKMGTIWFSSYWEQNLTRTQRLPEATSSQPCQVRNEATPSHQQITSRNSHKNTITHSQVSRSLFFLKSGLVFQLNKR